MEELLSGEKGFCLLNENYMQERGMSYQVGDVLDINLYHALYDDFDGVSGFVEITSSELEIAGFYQTAQESALEAADIVCPVAWLARPLHTLLTSPRLRHIPVSLRCPSSLPRLPVFP